MDQLHHGGDIYSYGGGIIDFSANINPLQLPKGVAAAIIESIPHCAVYPDPLNRKLRAAIESAEGIPMEGIVCGNGAADIIYRAVAAFRPKNALMPAPTFSEYGLALEGAGCRIHYFHLKEEENFTLQASILDQIRGMDMVFICNPNNPTGLTVTPDLLRAIAAACKRAGSILVVDECFNGFLDAPEKNTLKDCLPENHCLILLKAFTKLYAMAGIRLGYALTVPAVAAKIRGAGQAWPVSVIAEECGIAALKETDYVKESRALIRQERAFLSEELQSMGFKVYGGEANYLFFRCTDPDFDLKHKLLALNFLIRSCHNYKGLEKGGYYRIAVKRKEENQALINAIQMVLNRRYG